jgi:hypothetical protein
MNPSIHPLDNPGDIRYSFNRVTKWIQCAPPPQGEVPDVVKLATDVLARYLPSAGAAESSSGSVSISKHYPAKPERWDWWSRGLARLDSGYEEITGMDFRNGSTGEQRE